ncbi:hypothetical protein GCM10009853_023090 [Glycomyces scopariae]
MERTKPLNERQLMVLRLVGRGDDLGDGAQIGLRNSVRALQARDLVTVSRAGGRWQARVTEAGRYYLEHGSHLEVGTGDPESARALRQRARSSAIPAAPGKRHGDAAGLVARLVEDPAVEMLSLAEGRTSTLAQHHQLRATAWPCA